MKKKLFLIFLLLLLMPIFSVKAASITRKDIQGNTTATVGKEFSLSFYVEYDGVKKGTIDTLGVGGVVFELSFDDDVFVITGARNHEFDTKIGKENGKHYVMSTINENDPFKNKCVDEVLFCADYLTTITFYVKDTTKTSTDIKMGETSAILFKVGSDYSESDAVVITNNNVKSHTINITKNEEVTRTEPSSIVSNSKPGDVVAKAESKVSKAKEKATTTKISTTTSKALSSNNNLTSIEIKDNKIEFNKDVLEYKIYVDKKINSLSINAIKEDLDANVNVIGADDLKANNNKVLIEVTAKNGDKKTYVINVERSKEKKIISEEDEEVKPKFKLSKKAIKIIIIVLIIMSIIGLIYFVISYKKNKKLDKLLDDFDKF